MDKLLTLPDPLVMTDGNKVTTVELWRERRHELLELFRENVYGKESVKRPLGLSFDVFERSEAMEGKALRKQVDICYRGRKGKGSVRLIMFIPADTPKPAPVFLFINNRSKACTDPDRIKRSAFWAAEYIVSRGYIAAAFSNQDIDPDQDDGFKNGVHGIFDEYVGQRPPDAWGSISAWAWGAQRVMDYFETDPDIDVERVALTGHSRGGKTALWCGAQDERFAMIVSNNSGCGGAALSRGKRGEKIADINTAFPHWFCANYRKYNGRENDLPIDQHELISLIAPRLVYVASAEDDSWADPDSEFSACVAAHPVYGLFGRNGLGTVEKPTVNFPIYGDGLGYHVRTGTHDLNEYDWKCFVDFADKHMKK